GHLSSGVGVSLVRSLRVRGCFFFQAEDGIRDRNVTGVQTCALPIWCRPVSFFRDGYSLTAIKEKKVYRYDVKGRLVSIADFNGNRIWLRYVGDTLTQMEFPSGQSLSFTYNANKIASIRDTLGRTVRYTYDQELLTCVEYNNGGQIHYVYTPEGYLAQITDQNGHTYLKDEYDSLGRVTRQMLSNGQEYVLFYDDANRCNTFLD